MDNLIIYLLTLHDLRHDIEAMEHNDDIARGVEKATAAVMNPRYVSAQDALDSLLSPIAFSPSSLVTQPRKNYLHRKIDAINQVYSFLDSNDRDRVDAYLKKLRYDYVRFLPPDLPL